MIDPIDRNALLKELRTAQKTLESNDDKIWNMNQKYYKGLAWAMRIVLDAPAIGGDSE